jgi:hypothetical protein
MNFYKHFIGDYARDTGDLSLLEHGAYRLMLDHFYGTSRPLPENKKALYRLLRAESDAGIVGTEEEVVRSRVKAFFAPVPQFGERFLQYMDTEDASVIGDDIFEYIALCETPFQHGLVVLDPDLVAVVA